MGKFGACRTLLGTIFLQYLKIPLYEFVSRMNEDGEAAAEEEMIAEQNDDVVVEATKEEQWQAHPGRKTTTNAPSK
jgi:hypothetical protein